MATDTAWKPVNNNFHLSTGLVAHQAKQVKVRMHTSSDCKLAMGYLPWMGYNASGGGGVGRGSFTPEGGRRSLDIGFQPDEILIPSISSSTTTIKGFSVIPPFMEIKITPKVVRYALLHDSSKRWFCTDNQNIDCSYSRVGLI